MLIWVYCNKADQVDICAKEVDRNEERNNRIGVQVTLTRKTETDELKGGAFRDLSFQRIIPAVVRTSKYLKKNLNVS